MNRSMGDMSVLPGMHITPRRWDNYEIRVKSVCRKAGRRGILGQGHEKVDFERGGKSGRGELGKQKLNLNLMTITIKREMMCRMRLRSSTDRVRCPPERALDVK